MTVATSNLPWKIALAPSREAAVAISLDRNLSKWWGSRFSLLLMSPKFWMIVRLPILMPTTRGISNLSPVPVVLGRFAYALSRSLL